MIGLAVIRFRKESVKIDIISIKMQSIFFKVSYLCRTIFFLHFFKFILIRWSTHVHLFLQRTDQRFEEWADVLVKHGWRQSGKPRSRSLGCSTRPGGGTVSGYAAPEEWAQSLFYQSISVLLPFWDTLIADVFVLFLSFRLFYFFSPLPSLGL